MSEWWTSAYAGGGPAKPKGFPRACYPPDSRSAGRTPSPDGPDIKGYKRTVSHLLRWQPWDPDSWDDSYSNAFSHGRGTGMVGDSGIEGVQRQQGIDATGYLGEKTFNALRYALIPDGPNEGKQAMDSVAVNLINEAWEMFQEKPAPPIDDVKAAITEYCQRSISSEPKIHYSQNRPMSHLGVKPENGFTADCSGHSTSAYYWAQQELGYTVPDPNHNAYNGYGYTGTLISNPEVTSGNYQVGDLALYGYSYSSTSHVVTCFKAGDGNVARWCSHGSDAGPYSVLLLYRVDLLCVVRPGLRP